MNGIRPVQMGQADTPNDDWLLAVAAEDGGIVDWSRASRHAPKPSQHGHIAEHCLRRLNIRKERPIPKNKVFTRLSTWLASVKGRLTVLTRN